MQTIKLSSIKKLQDVVFIQLNRVTFDRAENKHRKINDRFVFPEKVDLTRFKL